MLEKHYFCTDTGSDYPLFEIEVVGDIDRQESATAANKCRTITVDVVDDDNDEIAMLGTSSDFSQRVSIYATEAGRNCAGEFGKKLRNMDTQLREKYGVKNGIAAQTKGRWGINVTNMPETSSILVRLGPFPPPDGRYLIKCSAWRIIETRDDGTTLFYGNGGTVQVLVP
jgi:hypothetical protein